MKRFLTISYRFKGFRIKEVYTDLKFVPLLISIALLFSVFLSSLNFSSASADHQAEMILSYQQDCVETIYQFLEDEFWMEKLINPIITTKSELDFQIQQYTHIHSCIEGLPEDLAGEYITVRTMTEYFIMFAGGYGMPSNESSFFLVDLQTSDDPAVKILRDQLMLEPPSGYVFVRIFRSRSVMPPTIAAIFRNEEISGITVFTRYIAILDEESARWEENLLRSQRFPKTLSHELVHAYIKSISGSRSFEVFPNWFDEGVAIYFSGSGENTSVVTPNGQFWITSTKAYQDYLDIFLYLEDELGKEHLYTLIRESIAENDPSILYRRAGIDNEQLLFDRVHAWKKKDELFRIGMIVLLIVLVAVGLLRLVPEMKCRYCGYNGKKKEFESGFCPNCGRRLF